MKLIEINWSPSDRQLRQFGVICLVALPLVGWIWGANNPVMAILALIGLSIAVAGFLMPAIIKPLFVGLMVVTTPIGMVLGEIAMLMLYFTVFLPIGLMFRLLKRETLQTKIDRHATSYWQPKRPPRSVASYYRQS